MVINCSTSCVEDAFEIHSSAAKRAFGCVDHFKPAIKSLLDDDSIWVEATDNTDGPAVSIEEDVDNIELIKDNKHDVVEEDKEEAEATRDVGENRDEAEAPKEESAATVEAKTVVTEEAPVVSMVPSNVSEAKSIRSSANSVAKSVARSVKSITKKMAFVAGEKSDSVDKRDGVETDMPKVETPVATLEELKVTEDEAPVVCMVPSNVSEAKSARSRTSCASKSVTKSVKSFRSVSLKKSKEEPPVAVAEEPAATEEIPVVNMVPSTVSEAKSVRTTSASSVAKSVARSVRSITKKMSSRSGKADEESVASAKSARSSKSTKSVKSLVSTKSANSTKSEKSQKSHTSTNSTKKDSEALPIVETVETMETMDNKAKECDLKSIGSTAAMSETVATMDGTLEQEEETMVVSLVKSGSIADASVKEPSVAEAALESCASHDSHSLSIARSTSTEWGTTFRELWNHRKLVAAEMENAQLEALAELPQELEEEDDNAVHEEVERQPEGELSTSAE